MLLVNYQMKKCYKMIKIRNNDNFFGTLKGGQRFFHYSVPLWKMTLLFNHQEVELISLPLELGSACDLHWLMSHSLIGYSRGLSCFCPWGLLLGTILSPCVQIGTKVLQDSGLQESYISHYSQGEEPVRTF